MTHPLAEIREGQEAGKPDWTSIVREAIIEELVTNTDGFHADALAELGIPDEHKSIIGSQIAKLVNERCMEECGRRKSAIASRNGAKSNVYRMTARGWKKLAGVGGPDSAIGTVDSGERIAGVATANPEGSPLAPPSADSRGSLDRPGGLIPFAADNGAGSSDGGDPGEPLSLLPGGAGAGRPLNPLTDAEAA